MAMFYTYASPSVAPGFPHDKIEGKFCLDTDALWHDDLMFVPYSNVIKVREYITDFTLKS